jgi:hypothetical protein
LLIDGLWSVHAEFCGTTFRLRRLPSAFTSRPVAHALTWPDYPEHWKVSGIAGLREGVASKLYLNIQALMTSKLTFLHVFFLASRVYDSRRRWLNYTEPLSELKRMQSSAQSRVVHGMYNLRFRSQTNALFWADIVVRVHGASVAKVTFEREATGVVEVWRCCREKYVDSSVYPRPWTGLVPSRLLGSSLSYIGCR